MNDPIRQPYRELADDTLKNDDDVKAIDEWLEVNIGKKSDVQADLEAYTRDMASARKTKQDVLIAQEKELADIRAHHSVQLKELTHKENLIIETHPTVEKIGRGVDDIISALLKTKKEVEQLDQIQQRLYGDEDIDRILKKPQDNMTDRVSALIQTEKENLQKACSGFHGKLCYFWSLVTPRNESAPFDSAYTYRDLPFMERMTLAMTETLPDTGPVGTTEGLLNHTEEPARCETAHEVVQPSSILWNISDKLVPSQDVRAPMSTRA